MLPILFYPRNQLPASRGCRRLGRVTSLKPVCVCREGTSLIGEKDRSPAERGIDIHTHPPRVVDSVAPGESLECGGLSCVLSGATSSNERGPSLSALQDSPHQLIYSD